MAGAMVAVKVTGWLTPADGSDDTTVVAVAVLPTVCVRELEELPTKFKSVEVNAATTLNEPLAGAEANVKLQTGTVPLLATVWVHRTVAVEVFVKVTVPLGTAVPVNEGVTTAVKATCWLTVDELGTDERVVVVLVAATTSVCVAGAPDVKLASPP
jgi:hypothetical protein